MIQDQVRLPYSVAIGVVLQGIRIRLGRSIVTVLGVVLGVAFLMSILTGQIIKKDVASEERDRIEVKRMMSFLSADTGSLNGATIAVLQAGPLSDIERRFLRSLSGEGVQEIRTLSSGAGAMADDSLTRTGVSPAELTHGARALLIAGDPANTVLDLATILHADSKLVVALTREKGPAQVPAGAISLQRAQRADELKLMEEDARRTRFRSVWITVISLVVTIFGICNSMLMSVTERFREIGTMRCLGALSSFIRRLFLIEACLMGVVGSVLGALTGATFAIIAYGCTYGLGTVLSSLEITPVLQNFVGSILAGVVLSIIAAIYPAQIASRMVPATALRSNI
jgi:ABC-type antimicrobial peptide transport system permease subunit